MADWFKFYENDLDETRLQYAISKLSEVTPVWVGILSECCRHKSDIIRWGSNEIELFGFSRRLNISIPKVNEAVNLLVEIEYIERGENTLKVLRWNKKQSEYCQKKMASKTDSVPTVPRHSTDNVLLEERRGDKKREDNTPKPKASECESIYQAYPRKVGKQEALKAIAKALAKTPFDQLLAKTEAYAKSRVGQDDRYTPHPSKWFNAGRYQDELEVLLPPAAPVQERRQGAAMTTTSKAFRDNTCL